MSETAPKPDGKKCYEVLRRMLTTPPELSSKPKPGKKKRNENKD
jgi:hypothetical protein